MPLLTSNVRGMKIKTTTLRAIFLAAIAPPILTTLYFSVLVAISWLDTNVKSEDLNTLFIIFVTAGVITIAHLLFLGLPAVWLLHKLNIFSLYTISIAGLLLGFLPAAIWSSSTVDLRGVIEVAGFCSIMGVASALVYWWACSQTPNNSSNLTGAQNAPSS